MRTAKKNEPFYIVNEMVQKEIYNFRPLSDVQNWKAIKIMSLSEISESDKDQANVFDKYDFKEQLTSILIVNKKSIAKEY